MRLTGWWSRRSHAAKVELYTRWTFHGFVFIEILAVGFASPREIPAPLNGWLFLLVCVHALLVAALASRALDWGLGRRRRPYRLIATVAALSAGSAIGVILLGRLGALDPPGQPHRDVTDAGVILVPGFLSFGISALVLCLPAVRHMLYLTLAAAAGTGLFAALLGLAPVDVTGLAAATLIGGLVFSFTSGFSGWLLRAVWQLDAARELQGRLAVAEERLRFGRDLHDVLGRNLSVIALKSELAVQLGRRGSVDGAVDQMAEVQRIAQESQREVRDVVRGYREADLPTELEGARGVLTAAGITCTMRDGGAAGTAGTAPGAAVSRPAAGTAGSGPAAGTAGSGPAADTAVLPARVQSALGWVVREATTNVLRHGDARNCTVSVRVADGHAVLEVVNDGAAPDTGGGTAAGSGEGRGATGGGSGLAGLRERLAALDGTLEAGPLSGGRFRVTARIPVREEEGVA
ncbi:sensor histidine kinase [Streptomyces sp. NPDC047928]|uniref:sensor histidine kinase n=1 Tax=unclassified Streptomyces TaxID=2593676 RepID=UPI00371352F3